MTVAAYGQTDNHPARTTRHHLRTAPSARHHRHPALQMVGLFTQLRGAQVQDVDITVPRGTAFGMVCPDDDERHVLLQLASGRLEPARGKVFIFGDVPTHQTDVAVAAGARAASVPTLPWHWTARDWITAASVRHRVDPMVAALRAEELLGSWYLAEAESITVGEFSPGMWAKLSVAAAIATAPRLLLVDEPFSGIDEESAVDVEALLADYVERGGTVVVSDRLLSSLERVCERAVVIVDSRLVAAGTVCALRAPVT